MGTFQEYKSSWAAAEKGLNKIADTLGRNRPAREIMPEDVLAVIRPIYVRGARAMADHVRSYVRSAYSWAIKSEHDHIIVGSVGHASLKGLKLI